VSIQPIDDLARIGRALVAAPPGQRDQQPLVIGQIIRQRSLLGSYLPRFPAFHIPQFPHHQATKHKTITCLTIPAALCDDRQSKQG